MNGNEPSFGSTAIIAQLTQIGSPPPLVLNYSLYGQATTSVLTYENQQNIIDAVTDPSQWVNDAPDGILVSMGGDDLIGDQFAIYLDYEGSGLDATPFQGALSSVRASYLDLFALRDAVLPGKPVIGHCYDYAIPNGVAPVCAGPWLQPSLEFSGYDLAESLAIVSSMTRRLLRDGQRAGRGCGEQFRARRHQRNAPKAVWRRQRLGERASSLSGGIHRAGAKVPAGAARSFPRHRSQLGPLGAVHRRVRRSDGRRDRTFWLPWSSCAELGCKIAPGPGRVWRKSDPSSGGIGFSFAKISNRGTVPNSPGDAGAVQGPSAGRK